MAGIASLFDLKPYSMTLLGIRKRFASVFGVENFTQSFHNNWKQALRAADAKATAAYPYGFFKVTNIQPEGEKNIVNMARVGTGKTISADGNNATVTKLFMFPVKLSLECEMKFSDALAAQQFALALSILINTRSLSFSQMYLGDTWTCMVTGSGGGNAAAVTPPVIEDLNDGSTPGTSSVQFQLEISTNIGFKRDVAKLNNYGLVNMRVRSGSEDGPATDDDVVFTEAEISAASSTIGAEWNNLQGTADG